MMFVKARMIRLDLGGGRLSEMILQLEILRLAGEHTYIYPSWSSFRLSTYACELQSRKMDVHGALINLGLQLTGQPTIMQRCVKDKAMQL